MSIFILFIQFHSFALVFDLVFALVFALVFVLLFALTAAMASAQVATMPSADFGISGSSPMILSNAAPKKKATAVPSLADYYEKLLAGKITFSKPKAKKDNSGFTIFPQDSSQAGSPPPQMLIPRTKCPFVPSYGKFKTEINAYTPMSMELSIEDNEFGRFVLKVFQEHDRNVRAAVAANSVTLFKRQLSDAELDFMHRKSIVPNTKTGSFPYLLRLKNHPTNTKSTKYFTVTGTGATGRPILRVSGVDTIEAFSEVMNSVDFSSVFCMPKQFGSTLSTRKCLHWPPVKRDRDADADNDMTADDMGDFEVESAPTTTPPASAGGNGNGGNRGNSGNRSNSGNSGNSGNRSNSGNSGNSGNDGTNDKKRTRQSPLDHADDDDAAPVDTPYENSDDDNDDDDEQEAGNDDDDGQ